MKLLAIETSTEACSAALYLDGAIRERYELAPRRHASLILPMVESLFHEAGLGLAQLDAVAFARGPGAFTGVRIATGVVQGLAFGADLPVVPVSTLAALAQGAYTDTGARRVLAAIDARINEVYWGIYRADEDGLMRLPVLCDSTQTGATHRQAQTGGGDEVVRTPDAVPCPEGEGWVGAGSGWGAYEAALRARLGAQLDSWDAQRYPRARDVATLAADGYRRGETVAPEQALPVYLRDDVALKQA